MNFDLSEIAPDKGDKYSPNLYRWLRKRQRQYRYFAMRVFKAYWGQGERYNLYIGFIHDGEFNGSNLNTVLCEGSKTEMYCFLGCYLEEVSDFWDTYRAIGRCAVDTAHERRFIGDESRYIADGDIRTCQWCGAVQHLRRWQETIERERWELVRENHE